MLRMKEVHPIFEERPFGAWVISGSINRSLRRFLVIIFYFFYLLTVDEERKKHRVFENLQFFILTEILLEKS